MLFLIIAFFFGLAGGVIGRIKGGSFLVWFAISAIPPFIGLLVAMIAARAGSGLRSWPRAPSARRTRKSRRSRSNTPDYASLLDGIARRVRSGSSLTSAVVDVIDSEQPGPCIITERDLLTPDFPVGWSGAEQRQDGLDGLEHTVGQGYPDDEPGDDESGRLPGRRG